jgi:hypothetical protein
VLQGLDDGQLPLHAVRIAFDTAVQVGPGEFQRIAQLGPPPRDITAMQSTEI